MWAVPKGCDPSRVLLCAHGGGYVVGSMYTHRKTYGHVAKAVGCRALIVHYGRAPENVHPGPVDDMVKAYKWLLDAGVQPVHVALIGDSAGGGLAVTTILRAREKGLPLPAASMPLSPWLDMEAKGETFDTNRERDVLVTRDVIGTMAHTFLGEHGSPTDPLANPLHADLRGLPPLYIQTGADEALLTDSRNLAETARRSGVDVTLEIVPEMQHVFQFLAGVAPEADAAIARLAKWVRPRLGLGS
jgi:acetyl esterase/lipase